MYIGAIPPLQELSLDVEIHLDWYLVQNACQTREGGILVTICSHVNLSSGSPNRIQKGGQLVLSVCILDFDMESESNGRLDWQMVQVPI